MLTFKGETNMIFSKKIPLLSSEDIEVKIKQCTKAGAVALLYKTARVDYRILDEVYGPLGWQIEYSEIKGNLYCTVSLWDPENKQWVKKTNCGIESREDGEGNEKKGEASDAAKRAGFVVGIGAELYTAPFIFLSVNTEQDTNGKWKLKDPYAKYVVTKIKYNEDTRVITALTIANEKTGTSVFDFEMPSTGAKAEKMERTVSKKSADNKKEVDNKKEIDNKKETAKPASKAASKVETTVETQPESQTKVQTEEVKPAVQPETRMSLKDLISHVGNIAKKMSKDQKLPEYVETIKDITGDPSFKCSRATEAQYDIVLNIYNALVAKGYDK